MKKKPTAIVQQSEQAAAVRDFRRLVVVGRFDEKGVIRHVGWPTGPVLKLQNIR